MSGARAGISAAEINKGGVGAATVKRYWPGKAPDWVDEDGEQARSEDEEDQRDEAEVSTWSSGIVVSVVQVSAFPDARVRVGVQRTARRGPQLLLSQMCRR